LNGIFEGMKKTTIKRKNNGAGKNGAVELFDMSRPDGTVRQQ